MSMTEELIEDRVHEGGEGGGRPPREANDVRDSEVNYGERRTHRPFSTRRPDGADVEEAEEEDESPRRKSGAGRLILVAFGLVVFLAAVGLGLFFFLSGGNRGRTQMQAGSETTTPGATRQEEETKREAQAALRAVTDSAVTPSAPPASSGSGDLSAPVAPDPSASTGFDPRSVSPYAAQPSASPQATDSVSGGRAVTPGDSNATPGLTGASDGTADSGPRSLRSAPPGGSYYFYPREVRQQRVSATLGGGDPRDQTGPSDLPTSPRPSARDDAPIKPPFGVLLPVRLLDSVVTIRDGGVVRLETTRAVSGAGGWRIPRGTTVVARLAGGNNDRAYMMVVGFIDAATNRLVNVGGEIKGADGAQGLRGERKRANSRWTSALKGAANAGVSLGSAYLLGRNGGGGNLPAPSQVGVSEPFPSQARANGNLDFIYVRAGSQGFVMVTDLPASVEGQDAATLNPSGQLSDDELARILTDGTPADIRAAMPRMNPELRKLAETILAQEEQNKGQK